MFWEKFSDIHEYGIMLGSSAFLDLSCFYMNETFLSLPLLEDH